MAPATIATPPQPAPAIGVLCRTCGTTLRLPLETFAATQIMRDHTNTHPMSCLEVAHVSGHLLDMLQFDCPLDADKWRELAHQTLDVLIDEVTTKR